MDYAPRKYALVTGAASGMGRIYAEKLAALGFGLLLVDINAPALEETASLARKAVPQSLADRAPATAQGASSVIPTDDRRAEGEDLLRGVFTAVVDLTAADAAEKVREAADAAGITVDVLINNAGMLFLSDICDTSSEKLRKMMALHCVTPLLLCHEFIPGMKERGWGRVLNISSMTSEMAFPLIGMYGNTKHFVKSYSKELRIECRGSGVSVTVVSFGAVDTPLFGFNDKQRRFLKAVGAMITPEKAVTKALRAMFKGRKSLTPGFLNRLVTVLPPLAPDWLISALVRRFGGTLTSMQK